MRKLPSRDRSQHQCYHRIQWSTTSKQSLHSLHVKPCILSHPRCSHFNFTSEAIRNFVLIRMQNCSTKQLQSLICRCSKRNIDKATLDLSPLVPYRKRQLGRVRVHSLMQNSNNHNFAIRSTNKLSQLLQQVRICAGAIGLEIFS